jgi:hypothetical protein
MSNNLGAHTGVSMQEQRVEMVAAGWFLHFEKADEVEAVAVPVGCTAFTHWPGVVHATAATCQHPYLMNISGESYGSIASKTSVHRCT